jgi:hypothetical protein
MKSFSNAAVRRLRLKKGDILVVRDPETCLALAKPRPGFVLGFVVPIVFAPQGLEKISRKKLLELLRRSS